ncbi:MAG: ParB/RepB/Spo0J family partition protein [Clostridia bacterium]|nr:ParB/RepB/Spo0J family partition protein [Clostridia bacterium]MBO5912938.1 ParB/RepB/Spo0J family partition protein [Clostridia bacterium]
MLTNRKGRERKLISLSPDSITASPFQPRREFDYYELLELSASILRNGIIQPLTVRKVGERYELISGERRLRAAVIAGLKSVPCILIHAGDRECSLMCLIENIQRTDLGFFEEAEGIRRLMDEFSLSQQDVSEKLGIAQSTLSNKLRLLKLTTEQRTRITAGGLTERHARAIIRLPDEQRDDVINRCLAEQLNVSETEGLVEKLLNPPKPEIKVKNKGSIGDYRILTNSITKMVGTIRRSGIEASSRKKETDSYIEYIITVPKPKGSATGTQMSVFDLIEGG